jgi:hypothetical protein
MTKEFIPYEESLELKELDYDKPCFGWYHDNILEVDFKIRANEIIKHHELLGRFKGCCLAPTFSQAFRFFREKYNILATVYSNASGYLYEWHDSIGGTHRGWSEYEGPNDGGVWDTYEQAELACLNKLISIVKNK